MAGVGGCVADARTVGPSGRASSGWPGCLGACGMLHESFMKALAAAVHVQLVHSGDLHIAHPPLCIFSSITAWHINYVLGTLWKFLLGRMGMCLFGCGWCFFVLVRDPSGDDHDSAWRPLRQAVERVYMQLLLLLC